MARKTVSDDFAVFPQRLSALMMRRKLTQQKLADALGVKRQTVSLYISGQSMPDAEQLRNIALFFGVSADWLLGLSEFETQDQRRHANDLADKIIELLEAEVDDGDRRRVTTALMALIDGFKSSLCNYGCYIDFENTVMRVMWSLNSASLCIKAAEKFSQRNLSIESRNSLCESIHDILDNAASRSYVEMGYFFAKARERIFEELDPTFYKKVDLSFSKKIAEIERNLDENPENK